MKKKLSVILSTILLLSCMPVNNAFAEKALTWIVEPSMVYDYIYNFSDGLADVRRGGKEVVYEYEDGESYTRRVNFHRRIDDKGNEVIPCIDASIHNGGQYILQSTDISTTIYDSKGLKLLELPYSDVTCLPSDLFACSKSGDTEITIYNIKGEIQYKLPYGTIETIRGPYGVWNYVIETLYAVKTETEFIIYTTNGEQLMAIEKKYSESYDSIYDWEHSCICIEETNSENLNDKNISMIKYNGTYILDGIKNVYSFYNETLKDVTIYQFEKDGKLGLIDKDANIISEAQYDKLERIGNDKIRVAKDEKYGLFNMDGSLILPCEYDSIEQFKTSRCTFGKDCYKINKNSLYGVCDETGNIIIEPKYSSIDLYNSNIAFCASDSGYTYISIYGEIVSTTSNYPGSVVCLSDNVIKTPEGLITPQGEYILNEPISSAELLDSNTVCYGYREDYLSDYEYTLFNLNNKAKRSLNDYTYAEAVKDAGIIVRNQNNSYGFINKNQDSIIPFEYEYISQVSNNTFLSIKKNGKYGIADYEGNILIPCEYDSIGAQYDSWFGYAKYRIEGTKDGKTYQGWINENNELVVPCIYDSIGAYNNGFIVGSNEKYGVIDIDGNLKYEPQFDYARFLSSNKYNEYLNYIIIKNGDKYGLCDFNGDVVVGTMFDSIYYIAENNGIPLLKVSTGDKYGVISTEGDIVVDINYDDIKYEWNLFKITKDNYDGNSYNPTYGLVETNGNKLIECTYRDIHFDYSKNMIIAQNEDGLWGLAQYGEKMPVNITSYISGNELNVAIENSESCTGTVIAAFYKDGSLINMEQCELSQGNSELKFDVSDEAETCKVFVWDSIENMKPISKVSTPQTNISQEIHLMSIQNEMSAECPSEIEYSDNTNEVQVSINNEKYTAYMTKNGLIISLSDIVEIAKCEADWNADEELIIKNQCSEVCVDKGNLYMKFDNLLFSINTSSDNLDALYVPFDVLDYITQTHSMKYNEDNEIEYEYVL